MTKPPFLGEFAMEDNEILDGIETNKEKKNLRTILNRGRMDNFELEEFMCADGREEIESEADV